MKLTLEPTGEFFMAGDIMVRMWSGTDADGSPVIAMVAGVTFIGLGATVEGLVSIPPPDGEAARSWAAEVLSKRYESGGK